MSYGSDISCLDQMVSGRLTSGPMVVVEALYRRLITPRGMLGGGDEESIYGFDVAGFVGSVGTEAAIRSLPDMVKNELLKDDRVVSISVKTTLTDLGDSTYSILLEVSGVLADENAAFQFSVGVSETSAQFLGGIT